MEMAEIEPGYLLSVSEQVTCTSLVISEMQDNNNVYILERIKEMIVWI